MVVMMVRLLFLPLLVLGGMLPGSSFPRLWGPKGPHEQPALLFPGGRGRFLYTPTHVPPMKPGPSTVCVPPERHFFIIHLPRGDTFSNIYKVPRCLAVPWGLPTKKLDTGTKTNLTCPTFGPSKTYSPDPQTKGSGHNFQEAT